jgi:Tol biopolymer transport system component
VGAEDPFWSPDNRFIAFFAEGKLKRIDVAGGLALIVCDGDWWGGCWSKRDVIVFAPGQYSGLLRVPAGGGSATPVTELDPASGEASHRYPWFLPDGRHFVYTALNKDPEKTAIYVADLDSKARHRVLVANSNAAYSPPGLLLFLRERALMAQPFDASKAVTTGDPVPIAEQVDTSSWGFAEFQGQFSVSQNGILAYSSGISINLQLTWVDRSGKVVGTVGTPGIMMAPTLSPDGNTVAVDRLDPQTGFRDIWLDDLKRGTASRFTFNSKSSAYPVWSPDGSHIAFSATPERVKDLYQKATSGATQDEALEKSALSKYTTDWSRDGRYIIYMVGDPNTDADIWVLPLFGDRKPFPYLKTEFQEGFGKLSPNGQWLAYQSNETKRFEVYVQTFPTAGGKWQVSTNGGSSPIWSRDGRELYFLGADQKMMVVEVKDSVKFEASVPKALFDVHTVNGVVFVFDVSKDGRFLIPTPVEQSASVPMTVVLNWQAALKK